MRFIIGIITGAVLILLLAEVAGTDERGWRQRVPQLLDELAEAAGDALALPPRPGAAAEPAAAHPPGSLAAAGSEPASEPIVRPPDPLDDPLAQAREGAQRHDGAREREGSQERGKGAQGREAQPDAAVARADVAHQAVSPRAVAPRSVAPASAVGAASSASSPTTSPVASQEASAEVSPAVADGPAAVGEDVQRIVAELFASRASGPDSAASPAGLAAPAVVAAAGADPHPQSSQTVWVPFRSEMSASGFAQRLSESLDHPFRVERQGPGRYQVVFVYRDEPQRRALLDEAAAATGLPL